MKVIKFLFLIIVSLNFINKDKLYVSAKTINKPAEYKYLEENMIRFHFIANSDSDFDQMVKNTLKDEVLKYLDENVKLTGNNFENMNNLHKNAWYIKKICKEVLKKFNLDQNINIKIGKKFFKERMYEGNLIPEGIYDSFIVYIGKGEGRNFWSMLFSNIGFIHDKKFNSQSMHDVINNNKVLEVSTTNNKKTSPKLSFKFFQVVKDLVCKIF